MFDELFRLCESVLAPFAAAQTFLAVMIYFIIVRKRIGAIYKFYLFFLSSFIILLIGRCLHMTLRGNINSYILLLRMSLFYSLGLPSLLVIVLHQMNVKKRALTFWAPYVFGLIISIVYIVYMGTFRGRIPFESEVMVLGRSGATRQIAHFAQVLGNVVLIIIPYSYFILRALISPRNSRLIAFLVSSLIFGITFVIGMFVLHRFTLYYLSSILVALCWAWVVFQDICSMSGRVTLLKQEMQFLVSSRDLSAAVDMEILLDELENLSHHNLNVYKMRIREILCMFTDITIEAGGDTEDLLKRNFDKTKEIEASENVELIRTIVSEEVAECREIIADIPSKQSREFAQNAKEYIETCFTRDIAIEDIAKVLGMSRSHFMREFKKGTGQTVNQYITERRISLSKELLLSNSVSDTAFAVGFNNSNYFSTVFKKHTGLSPLQYLKSLEK